MRELVAWRVPIALVLGAMILAIHIPLSLFLDGQSLSRETFLRAWSDALTSWSVWVVAVLAAIWILVEPLARRGPGLLAGLTALLASVRLIWFFVSEPALAAISILQKAQALGILLAWGAVTGLVVWLLSYRIVSGEAEAETAPSGDVTHRD